MRMSLAVARYWLASMMIGAALLSSAAAQPMRGERPAMPVLQLPGFSQGQRAIDLLGTRLPEVAAHYRKSPAEFASILLRDRTARLDRQGRLFHVEDFAVPQGAGTVSGAATPGTTTSAPLAQTFLLHSRPGASKVIYLDFNGHTATGTVWNSSYQMDPIVSPPFDLDGSPYSWSDAELTRIQAIWRRVAEDFAPFDVDVTTEEPPADRLTRTSSTDSQFGMRAVITRDFTASTASPCGCGGFAYVGVFDYTGDSYKPAYIFFDKLGGGNEKYVAEAISHEVGHTLGLSHDGTATTAYYQGQGSGPTGWAPIMGVGYYQPLVQWSRGEYAGANNREDDFAIIQANGLAYRADDHGNTIASATRLIGASAGGVVTYTAQGVIELSTDVDVLAIDSAAGTVSVTVSPALTAPNLDVVLQLRNAANTVIATSAPIGALGGSLSVNVPAAGTYYLSIAASGEGDPLVTGYSSYGSVGEYSLTASAPAPGNLAPVAVPTVSASSGTAPLTVTLSGSGSYDTDGTIVGWAWNFGDSTAAGTGPSVSHTYTSPGQYSASLTVTDNAGFTDTKAVSIQVGSPPVATLGMSVKAISVVITTYRNGQADALAAVTVTDSAGNRVVGATVSGAWSGVISGSASALTGSDGVARIKSSKTRSAGTFTFTVGGISLAGYAYVPAGNVETSDSAVR